MVEWLQKTPKTTTIRVNLLRVSSAEVKTHILKVIMDLDYLPVSPIIEIFQPIPEIILIRNIDEKYESHQQNQQLKEIIVDVPCGVAVLRGSHIYAPGVLAMESNTQANEIVNIFTGITQIQNKIAEKESSPKRVKKQNIKFIAILFFICIFYFSIYHRKPHSESTHTAIR